MKRPTQSALLILLAFFLSTGLSFTLSAAQDIPNPHASIPQSSAAQVAEASGESGGPPLTVKVINGTTGGPGRADYVELTSLGMGGMNAAGRVEDVSGEATFPGLTAGTLYLVRTAWQGAVYSHQVTFEPGVAVNVAVFDSTRDDPGVDAVLDTVIYQVEGDSLFVSRRYDIVNNTMMSWVNPEGTFRVKVPAGAKGVRARVNPGTVWIDVPLIPTEVAGQYKVDRPILNNETQVDVGYTFPYGNHKIVIEEPFGGFAQPPAIAVIPHDVGFQAEGYHSHDVSQESNASIYMTQAPVGDIVTVTISGEGSSASSGGSAANEGGSRFIGVPPYSTSTMVIYTVGFFVILGACVLISLARKNPSRESLETLPASKLKSLENELVGKIAQLDDLHEAGKVSESDYRHQRKDLVEEATRITRRLTETGAVKLEGK